MAAAYPSLSLIAAAPAAAAPVCLPIERARRGDPSAFRQIHQQYYGSVRRLLLDLLRDAASADEAAQETFVRAFIRIDTLKDDARLHGWLLGIARRVAMEQRRSFRRLWPLQPRCAVEPKSPSPEDHALARESVDALQWALQQLREERRLALLLRADQGLSCEDVAEVLGWSLAKTKVELHRARLQLRELIEKYPGHGGAR